MKNLLTTGLVLIASQALADRSGFEFKEALLYDAVHSREIELNDSTVLCSSADYGALFLKILIPSLKDITLLDHRNQGAGAPCVAAGRCIRGRQPKDIIDAERPTEPVKIGVKLTRTLSINHDEKTCQVGLRENIVVPIRGFNFVHRRTASLGERNYLDCL